MQVKREVNLGSFIINDLTETPMVMGATNI